MATPGRGDNGLPNGDGEDCTQSACGAGYRCNLDTKRCENAGMLKAEPDLLDFGAVPFNTEVKRTLVVSNAGRADLKVSGLEFENGTNPDPQNPIFNFTASKAIPVTLAVGESVNVEVSFRQDDARPDVGALLITSTDDRHPLTRVPLKSGYKGTPDLAIVDSGVTSDCAYLFQAGDFTIDIGNVDLGARRGRRHVQHHDRRRHLSIGGSRCTKTDNNSCLLQGSARSVEDAPRPGVPGAGR